MKINNLVKLCIKLDREYDQRCAIREVAILAYLIENGETAIGEVGIQLMMGQPVVSRFIKKLEPHGFVARTDGKVVATDKAREFFKDM